MLPRYKQIILKALLDEYKNFTDEKKIIAQLWWNYLKEEYLGNESNN